MQPCCGTWSISYPMHCMSIAQGFSQRSSAVRPCLPSGCCLLQAALAPAYKGAGYSGDSNLLVSVAKKSVSLWDFRARAGSVAEYKGGHAYLKEQPFICLATSGDTGDSVGTVVVGNEGGGIKVFDASMSRVRLAAYSLAQTESVLFGSAARHWQRQGRNGQSCPVCCVPCPCCRPPPSFRDLAAPSPPSTSPAMASGCSRPWTPTCCWQTARRLLVRPCDTGIGHGETAATVSGLARCSASTNISWRLHSTVFFASGTHDGAVLVHTSQQWLTHSLS